MPEQPTPREAAAAASDRAVPDDGAGKREYAGARGLPPTGRGSLAGWGARITALFIDWMLANLAAYALVRDTSIWQAPVTVIDFVPLGVFALEVWLMTAFVGASIGQRLRHLVVARLDGVPVGLVRAGIRTALILLVVPPLIVAADGRGLHDRLAGTVVVRAR